jgi:hypothetical protein
VPFEKLTENAVFFAEVIKSSLQLIGTAALVAKIFGMLVDIFRLSFVQFSLIQMIFFF